MSDSVWILSSPSHQAARWLGLFNTTWGWNSEISNKNNMPHYFWTVHQTWTDPIRSDQISQKFSKIRLEQHLGSSLIIGGSLSTSRLKDKLGNMITNNSAAMVLHSHWRTCRRQNLYKQPNLHRPSLSSGDGWRGGTRDITLWLTLKHCLLPWFVWYPRFAPSKSIACIPNRSQRLSLVLRRHLGHYTMLQRLAPYTAN